MTEAGTAGRPVWPRFGAPGFDQAWLQRHADFCSARQDLADHRLLLILRALLQHGDELAAADRELARQTVIGFRYSLTEPGRDSMSSWSESHQLVFATCEYLAGQLFGRETFRNDGRRGVRHQRVAKQKLQVWLADRFRFGFSEWLSTVHYLADAAALVMLIDHSAHETVAKQAAMVLDLIMLDAALHRFEGNFIASAGCSPFDVRDKPDDAEFNVITDAFFNGSTPALNTDSLAGLAATSQRYVLPPLIKQIASDTGVRRVRTSQGLDLGELAGQLACHPDFPRTGKRDLWRFQWAMGALTTPETIGSTLETVQTYGLQFNPLLAPLTGFLRIPRPLRARTIKTLNPITAGSTLERANVQTFRTPSYLLSSVQNYHPGGWGGHEALWRAALPDGISVFGTHPGSTDRRVEAWPSIPSDWLGNGINPHVGQHDNVLLSLVDLRGRRGHFEGRRHQLIHFHFPAVDFDEARQSSNWIAGRRGQSYIAILSTNPLELVSQDEVVQRGTWLGYAVLLSDDEEFTSMADFLRHLKELRLNLTERALSFESPYARYELGWGQVLRINGRLVDSRYPRYDTQWGRVPRNPRTLTLASAEHQLHHDWPGELREFS